jgi:hypothetical protein
VTSDQKSDELRAAASSNIYRRAKLATELLADMDWIAEQHDGDEFKARDVIESTLFPDLRSFTTLGRLKQLYTAYPDDAQWRLLRYDLAAMEAMYNDEHKPAKVPQQRTNWKQKAAELEEKLHYANAEIARLKDRIAELGG